MRRLRWPVARGVALILLVCLGWRASSEASTMKLQWDVPTLNADGTPLTDLAGYRLTFCAGATCDPSASGTDIVPDLGLVTTYLHAGRTPGTVYNYEIRAKRTGGQISAFSTTARGTAPVGDLVALWFRNETGSTTTAADGGWFGYPGQLCEGATCPQQGPTWVTGQITTALRCDGVNDNVDVSHNAAMDLTGDMSLAFWLRLVSTTHLGNAPPPVIAGKESATTSTPWLVNVTNVATPHLGFYHHTNGGAGTSSMVFTADTIPLNTWRHIVIVRTITSPAKTLRLYINGTLIANACGGACTWTTDEPQASAAILRVCANFDRNVNRYAQIDLDEVRLYDYALTQTQITQLAIAPAAPAGIQLR